MSEFRDVYTKITNRIVADLEQGVRPWMRPWGIVNLTLTGTGLEIYGCLRAYWSRFWAGFVSAQRNIIAEATVASA